MLTGFLCCRKTVTKRYYCGGLRVVGLYLFWSVITCIYLIIYREGVTKDVVMGVLSFSTIRYGWYIEMWIGLFLMVPFLNILWWNCPSKKHKLLLIGTLFSITSGSDLHQPLWRTVDSGLLASLLSATILFCRRLYSRISTEHQ